MIGCHTFSGKRWGLQTLFSTCLSSNFINDTRTVPRLREIDVSPIVAKSIARPRIILHVCVLPRTADKHTQEGRKGERERERSKDRETKSTMKREKSVETKTRTGLGSTVYTLGVQARTSWRHERG